MKRKLVLISLQILFFSFGLLAQNDFKSEDDLKEKASELFENEKFVEAEPLFAQLLSLYPQDPTYNYRYGACLLYADGDKTKPLTYLKFAVSKSGVDPLAYYYLGRANHLNYNFGNAVKYYSRFKTKASTDQKQKYQLDRKIEMCKNGNQLLSKLNEVQVLERQVISEKDFFRVYELDGIDGKLLAKPEDFKSKYDKKIDEKSVIYLPKDAKEVYYSSYGKKGENGRDIYKSIKLGNGGWSEGVSIGESINTPFDEDYPFIHPDGRTLYFASKGHNSMGGFDLFKSTFDLTSGQWTNPENLDFAFCSTGDDVLFVTDKDQVMAYFASNRTNEAGKYTVYKVLVDREPIELSVIKGKFIAENNPNLSKAKITVIDKATNKTIGIYETNSKGEYDLEIQKNGGTYQFNIETTEDAPIHTGVVTIPKQDEFEVLGQELRLVGEGDQQLLVIKNIFDGTTAQNLTSSGPQVSANVLRSKANLDINFSANQLAALEKPNEKEDATETSEQVNKTNQEASNEINQDQVDENNPTSSTNASVPIAIGVSIPIISNQNSAELTAEAKVLKDKYQDDKQSQAQILSDKQVELNNAFLEAMAIENQAAQEFDELKNLQSNNSSEEELLKKEKEAKMLALRAAFATEIAQSLESDVKEVKNTNTSFEQKEAGFNTMLENNELSEAELQLKELNSNKNNTSSSADQLSQWLSLNNEEIEVNKSSIASLEERIENFDNEKNKLSNQIADLEKPISKAEGEKKENLNAQLEGLKLDLKDISFQEEKASSELNQVQNENLALKVKSDQLAQATEYVTNTNGSEDAPSSSEKSALVSKMKKYKADDQLAYIGDNDINLITNSSGSNSGNDLSVEEIERLANKHNPELAESEKIQDNDLKNARKVQVYDNWINELEAEMITKEVQIGSAKSEESRTQLQNDIAAMQREIDQKTIFRDEAEESVAFGTSSIIALDQDIANSEIFDDEDITLSPVPQSVSEVDDMSYIPDGFTNLKFDQSVKLGNVRPSQTMGVAKKALFEAREYALKAEEARQQAYSLPTVEERSAAFERANNFEKESEKKQLEAADIFGDYNKQEYQINRRRIYNANQYEDEFESDALDLANLLAEEGQVYFNDAAQIRREIILTDRLSKKEVALQKAYDYEVLALKKQRQALTKISLVDDEYLKQVNVQGSQNAPAFVQTITDVDVLNVKNPDIAQKRADSLYASVETLESLAEQKLAESQSKPVGEERDSLLAVYADVNSEIESNKVKAAIYYERKKQLENGSTNAKIRFEEPTDGITAPVYKAFRTEVALETIEINESRKQVVLNSNAFVEYSKNKENRDRVAKEASTEYTLAISLSEEKQKLVKDALIARNQAELEKDLTEKERLVKSAEVIDQKVIKNQSSIDSLNTSIKVKNYLISTSNQKMNASVENLNPTEKKEIIQLATVVYTEAALADAVPASSTLDQDEVTGTGELNSEETSEAIQSIEELGTDENNQASLSTADANVPIEIEEPSESITTDQVEPEPEFESTPEPIFSEPAKTVVDIDETPAIATPENKPVENNNVEVPVRDNAGTTASIIDITTVNEVPRQLKQAIFITLNKNEAAYSRENPIPESTNLPEGLVFKVQVGAFRNPIPQNLFKGFAPLYAEKIPSGITRYTAGLFNDERTAISARNEIRTLGYPDAFVVAFLNGNRITITQARGGNEAPSSLSSNGNTFNNSSNEGTGFNNQSNANSSTSLSQAFNEDDVAEVVNAKTIEQVYYTVQIGVFSKPVKKGTFDFDQLNVVELPNGLIRYNAGVFDSAIEAADTKNTIQLQIPDAFVTAYKKGDRISLNDASKMKNEGQ